MNLDYLVNSIILKNMSFLVLVLSISLVIKIFYKFVSFSINLSWKWCSVYRQINRAANFSVKECSLLLDCVKREKANLFLKPSTPGAIRIKNRAWNRVSVIDLTFWNINWLENLYSINRAKYAIIHIHFLCK